MVCFDALNDEWLSLGSSRELRGSLHSRRLGALSAVYSGRSGVPSMPSAHPHPSGPVPTGLSTRTPILGTAASPVFLREDCIPSSRSVDT